MEMFTPLIPGFVFCLQYAQESQHEKILRGLALALAFTMFARLEEADSLIARLMTDKDPILRRSAMHTIAMAYAGSGNSIAIRKLLHFAVSYFIFILRKLFAINQLVARAIKIRNAIAFEVICWVLESACKQF